MSLEREKRTVRLAEKLAREGDLSDGELLELIREASARCLRRLAGEARDRVYGKKIYIRGLIEFTNYCRNNCFYCGIRRGNEKAVRYRLKEEEILECCREGFELGFRTFVLQGGEDPWYNDERLEHLVRAVRREFPDCAITLSVGERSRESYERLFAAGVDRYLLRHETAVKSHYEMLHPAEMSFDHRMQCLRDLREIRGSYLEVTAKSFYEGRNREDYLHITLTDEEDVPDGAAKLRVIYPNLMKLDYDNRRTRATGQIRAAEQAEKKSPLELFGEFYQKQNNQEMSQEQSDFVRELIEKIWEGDR